MPIVVALAVILFAIPLKDLAPEPATGRAMAPSGSAPAKPSPPEAMRRAALRFDGRNVGRFDRDAFLSAFERQSRPGALNCLRSAIGSRGSVVLMARLHRNGRLSAVRVLDDARGTHVAASDCARLEIGKMEFDPRALRLDQESVEIEWRVDW